MTHVPVIPLKCAACDRPLELPMVCTGCHTLYPVDGLNYFEMLGLPVRFELDVAELRARFLRLSREVHPDRAGLALAETATRISADANRAFDVLRDPLLRAEYLLELAGGPSAADDRSAPADVLARTLALREELDEARAAADPVRLAALGGEIRTEVDRRQHAAAELARRLPGDEALRAALRRELNGLKYFSRLLEQV